VLSIRFDYSLIKVSYDFRLINWAFKIMCFRLRSIKFLIDLGLNKIT